MSNQNLIIYKLSSLYHTLKELDQDLNFEVYEATNEKNLSSVILNLQDYLIISSKKISSKSEHLILDKLPIKLSQLLENLNIQLLKRKFAHQSSEDIASHAAISVCVSVVGATRRFVAQNTTLQ